MKKNKTYKGQALAIAMVIVIISSVIAVSVYFRTQKEKLVTLEERASSEALEISDAILERLIQYDIEQIREKISLIREENISYATGTNPPLKENINSTEISSLFLALNITDDIRNLGVCPLESRSNEYQLTLKEIDPNTFFEVRDGQVWSLPIKNTPLGQECSISISFSVRGNSNAGFLISKIYINEYNEYLPYQYEDTLSYCFSQEETKCIGQDLNLLDTGWIKYNVSDRNNSIEIPLTETKGEYKLEEIRVRATGGTVGIKYEISPSECKEGLRMISLRSTAYCSGIYRGKEVHIPEKKWHNTLFDYVIFNGDGSL